MKKFNCDICKKSVGSDLELTTLYEKYQPEGVEHICDDCQRELMKAKNAMDRAVEPLKNSWVQRIIKKMIKP